MVRMNRKEQNAKSTVQGDTSTRGRPDDIAADPTHDLDGAR